MMKKTLLYIGIITISSIYPLSLEPSLPKRPITQEQRQLFLHQEELQNKQVALKLMKARIWLCQQRQKTTNFMYTQSPRSVQQAIITADQKLALYQQEYDQEMQAYVTLFNKVERMKKR